MNICFTPWGQNESKLPSWYSEGDCSSEAGWLGDGGGGGGTEPRAAACPIRPPTQQCCTIFYGDEMNMLASAYEKGRDERMEEGASHCNALMLT